MSDRTGIFAGDDPFAIARAWLKEAEASEINDPNAIALSTVDADGMPNTRMVLLKEIEDNAFVFYTNYDSAKSQEIAATGKASFVMHWKSLRRQIRVRGHVSREDGPQADAYYKSRSLKSRLGAWASKQSQPLSSRAAQMAEVLGWETMIAYNCHAQLLPLRFPKSASLKFVSPKSFAQECLYDQRTAIILMSHSYQNDLDAFKSILKTGKTPSYLGVLGPKKRTYKMLNELGIPYPEYLKAPVGLEIGAEGPEEIALSIVSEIKAVLSNSPATPLSQKSSPIHDRSEQVIKEEIFLDIV